MLCVCVCVCVSMRKGFRAWSRCGSEWGSGWGEAVVRGSWREENWRGGLLIKGLLLAFQDKAMVYLP